MGVQELWGIVATVWVVAAAVGLAGLYLRLRSYADAVERFGAWWTPGFLVTIGLYAADAYPEAGIVWSLLYVLGASAFAWVIKRRPPRLSLASRAFIAGAGLWILSVQSWGFIYEWDDSFTDEQFSALHFLPPLLVIVAWRAYRWVFAPRVDPSAQ